MSFNQQSNQFTIQKIVGQTTASPNLNILDVQFARPDPWISTKSYSMGDKVFNTFDRKIYESSVTPNLNKRPDLNESDWFDDSDNALFRTFGPGTPMMFELTGNRDLIVVKIQEFSPLGNRKLAAGIVIHDTKRQNRGIISPNSETSFRIASRGSVVYLRSRDGVSAFGRGSQVGYDPAANPNLTTDPRITFFPQGNSSPIGITLDEVPFTSSGGTVVRVLIMIPIIPKIGT